MKRSLTTNTARTRPISYSLLSIVALVRPHTGAFIIALVSLAIGSGINLVFPEIIRRALRPEALPFLEQNLVPILLGLAGLFVGQGIVFFLRSYLFGVIGHRVYTDLRKRLFEAVLAKDTRFFDRNRSGDLAARINSDAALVQEAVAVKLSVIVRYGLQVVCGVVLMTWMSWRLTIAIVCSVLVIVGVSSFFIKGLKTASRRYQGDLARLTSFAAEVFSGSKIVRALGATEQVSRRYATMNGDVLAAGRKRALISASFSSGASMLLNLLLLGVLWYGVSLVFGQSLPLNELAAFVLYGAIVAVSFSFLVSAYAEVSQSLGGLERVLELLEQQEQVSEPSADGEGQGRPSSVRVDFSGVSFSYPDRADHVVLSDFSCELLPGRVTALVGPSGAGKSSVVQLLLRLYEKSGGEIRLDGTRLEKISEAELRHLVAWVPQEPQLFSMSIYENLMLGNDEILRDETLKTVSGWDFMDFIEPLEHGIDTMIGEHGALLSGGQRQRIAIARALLRKPALLVLDEATSGLDSHTEASVMKVVRHHIPSATILVISHRLSTVRDADSIYVINEGRVFESGTHDSLSARQGLYREYVAKQALG